MENIVRVVQMKGEFFLTQTILTQNFWIFLHKILGLFNTKFLDFLTQNFWIF